MFPVNMLLKKIKLICKHIIYIEQQSINNYVNWAGINTAEHPSVLFACINGCRNRYLRYDQRSLHYYNRCRPLLCARRPFVPSPAVS